MKNGECRINVIYLFEGSGSFLRKPTILAEWMIASEIRNPKSKIEKPYSFPFLRIATSSQMPIIAAAENSRIPIREMP